MYILEYVYENNSNFNECWIQKYSFDKKIGHNIKQGEFHPWSSKRRTG